MLFSLDEASNFDTGCTCLKALELMKGNVMMPGMMPVLPARNDAGLARPDARLACPAYSPLTIMNCPSSLHEIQYACPGRSDPAR